MIKSKKQMFLVITIFTLVMMLGTISYAFFNYTRTGATNELLVGNIYFNHTQGNSISLINEFPETREEARGRNDNYITLQITGINESNRDIYYKFILSHGEDVENKVRIDDEYLRFDLIEVEANNEEKYILYNEKFDTINNTIILKDRVDAGTSNSITRNYKLRMWIDENLLISDTNENRDYTASEYANLFATIKVTAKGEMQNVYYYNSFDSAVTAINEETYVSETDRNSAKTGIYIDADDNSTNLVFYDDSVVSDSVTINNPVNINLYGYTLEYKYGTGQYNNSISFTADSIFENGTVIGEDNENGRVYNLLYSGNIRGIIRNIHYVNVMNRINYNFDLTSNSVVTIESVRNERGVISGFDNASFKLVNTNMVGYMYAVMNSKLEIEDSYIFNNITKGTPTVMVGDSGSSAIITNTTIFGDSPGCYINGSNNLFYSVGISNSGTLIVNSGYVFGTHSAIETRNGSKTYVYGGTFESTDHGGFYFSHGTTGVAYIENANIKGVSYPAQGTYRPNGVVDETVESNGNIYTLEEAKTAFYSNGNLSPIYLVNCNISAVGDQVIAMKTTSSTQNIYMSGCTFNNTRTSQYLRVDNANGMKLYFGYNNNFGNIANISNSGNLIPFATAKQNGIIVETNATYKDIVRPE